MKILERVTIALGGNALGNTPEEQKAAVKITSKSIVDLIEDGKLVTIVHGNGPQVGMIKKLSETAHKFDDTQVNLDLPECGAMSQGYIGYHLQNALVNELRSRNIDIPVVSLVSQVEVSEADPAFENPTKPIGGFMTKEEAEKLIEKGLDVVEDSGRGYRQVVASPKPIRILEEKTIKTLIEQGSIVIAGGGGGIPVVEKNGSYLGVPAVIDKDLTAVKIAQAAGSDKLIILTAVEYVYRGFNTDKEEKLE